MSLYFWGSIWFCKKVWPASPEYPISALPALGYRHKPQCPAFMWVLGMWTQVLMLLGKHFSDWAISLGSFYQTLLDKDSHLTLMNVWAEFLCKTHLPLVKWIQKYQVINGVYKENTNRQYGSKRHTLLSFLLGSWGSFAATMQVTIQMVSQTIRIHIKHFLRAAVVSWSLNGMVLQKNSPLPYIQKKRK